MKHLLVLLLAVCLVGAGLLYLWAGRDNRFTGSYVGPVKVPGAGWTAARIHIVKEGRDFEVTATAGRYQKLPTEAEFNTQMGRMLQNKERGKKVGAALNPPQAPKFFSAPPPAPPSFMWVEDLGASYRAKLVGGDLVLDAQMGLIFTKGRLSGTLAMPDGTVFKKDTPANYQALREELRQRLLQQEPGASILE
jgi:hypothetical protein